jgi:hypothetical protein
MTIVEGSNPKEGKDDVISKENYTKDDKSQDKDPIKAATVINLNPAPAALSAAVADEATTILLSAPDQDGHRQIINDDADFSNNKQENNSVQLASAERSNPEEDEDKNINGDEKTAVVGDTEAAPTKN